MQELIPAYSQAVCQELIHFSRSSPTPITIHTIYFGGGTPSLLPVTNLEAIFAVIKSRFILSSPEITLEANPGTVTPEYLAQIKELGVNRLSLGMQSADPDELSLLERHHSFVDVVNSVSGARAAGIMNLNLDLIFGLPHQALPAWLITLEAALSLVPDHLSLYALTLEHGTPLMHKVDAGNLPEPDPDLAADMYEAGRERLSVAGYNHYEISNWAHHEDGVSYACLHNLQYWRSLPYIGVGAGAHGFVDNYRTVNIANPRAYIDKIQQSMDQTDLPLDFPRTPASIEINFTDSDTLVGEWMMMGLRLVDEGVKNSDFEQRFGTRLQDKFPLKIERLVTLGLLEWVGPGEERLRLTQMGQLLGNQVFREFI